MYNITKHIDCIQNWLAENNLDAFLFASKHNCSVLDAQEYLELTQDIFNDTNHQKIEILREKIGLKPSIMLDRE